MCNDPAVVTDHERSQPQAEPVAAADLWQGIFRVQVCLGRELDRRLEERHELSLGALQALACLEAAGGRMRMGDLAEAVGLSRSGLTRLADRLEQGGLVARDRCCDDARGAYATLTGVGRARAAEARVTFDEVLGEMLLAHLGADEQVTIVTALERVLGAGPADCGCGR